MTSKQQIIDQFSHFVNTETNNIEPLSIDTDGVGQPPDLMSLFEALTVLKTQVKTESRQVKTALDEFRSVFANLNHQQAYLQQNIDSKQQQLDRQHEQLLKPLMLVLIEFYDRLSVSINAIDERKPEGLLARFRLGLWHKTQTIKAGQQITLRQLQRVLNDYQVEKIPCVDKPYDPALMKVVATSTDNSKNNNIVLSEQLSGFLWQGQLLRPAEVNVNQQDNIQ